jgi:hypothetical protein
VQIIHGFTKKEHRAESSMPPDLQSLVERLEKWANLGRTHAADKELRKRFICRCALMVRLLIRGKALTLTSLAARRRPLSLVI